jgi:hypothetical protein
MDAGSATIDTPLHEKQIAAVHRGAGPRDLMAHRWQSFDRYLQELAVAKGAHLVQERVAAVSWLDDRPRIELRGGTEKPYELVVVATGVNGHELEFPPGFVFDYDPPRTVKTFLREYYVGEETIEKYLGSAMHVFLLNLPGLEFAAMIPKGGYVSACLLGDDIDKDLIRTFLESEEVKGSMPPDWDPDHFSCWCSPRINVGGASPLFADRMVFIGDSGVTRLYKDGIGAAYRAAKAAADFHRHHLPTCRTMNRDNAVARLIFGMTREIQRRDFARRAVLRMVVSEQRKPGPRRRMSTVLWDTFTGSAPYREILLRTLHPAFLARFPWDNVVSVLVPRAGKAS